MWQIIKSLFRYSLKHRISLLTLTFLTFLATAIFASLLMLSSNLTNSHETIVKKGNLNNLAIHELYSTTVADQPELKGDAAKAENKKRFDIALSELIGAENYRDYKSIDFNVTTSGYAYKIVQNSPDYTIDKVVISFGNDLLPTTYDFETIINNATWDVETPIAGAARRDIVYFSAFADWTSTTPRNEFLTAWNAIKDVTDENDVNYDPKTNTNVSNNVKERLRRWLSPEASDYFAIVNKGYRIAFDWLDAIAPVVGRFDNFSAYSNVGPDYVLEAQNKTPLPDSLYEELQAMNQMYSGVTQNEYMLWLSNISSEHKIKIDNLEFLILGAGISPSFMYPVFSFDRPTPNIDSEVLLYGNNSAYELAFDSNRSSPTETYIVGKVLNLNQALVNQINVIAGQYMSWPSNVRSAYFADDVSNQLSAAAIRLNFIPGLVVMQVGLSNSLSLFIGALLAMMFLFSIRKFIDDNRSSLSILRANGIKKRSIIFSSVVFGLFPGIVGGMFGYIFAQFSQTMLLGMYSSHWVLPISLTVFNPFLFFGLLLVPFVFMGILSIIASYITLRQNTYKLMSESAKFRITPFAKSMTALLARGDILSKFRTSIAFSSLSKLTAITTLFTLLTTALSFSAAMSDKFKETKAATFNNKSYQFAFDMLTPTVQGGQYFRTTFDDMGMALLDSDNHVMNFTMGSVDSYYGVNNVPFIPYLTTKLNQRNQNLSSNGQYLNYQTIINEDNQTMVAVKKNPNFAQQVAHFGNSGLNQVGYFINNHLPSTGDSNWQKTDLLYLKNRVQTPASIDVEVGFVAGSLGAVVNPWDVARNLAPPNVMVNADNLTHSLWTAILNDTNNTYFIDYDFAQYNSIAYKTTGFSQYDFRPKQGDFINKALCDIYIDFGFMQRIADQNAVDITSKTVFYKEPSTASKHLDGWYRLDKEKFKGNLGMTLNINYNILTNLVLSLSQYQPYLFKSVYNYAPLDNEDETYTRVEANSILNNQLEGITIKGIKPNSKYIDLLNKSGEKVNQKLVLANGVETLFENNLHRLYESWITTDTHNYKVIINESAAYQYKLDIGSKIEINPINEATRYNPGTISGNDSTIDYSNYNNAKYTLEVVDIVTTYQYPEFYINQRIANHLNAMDYPTVLNTSYTNEYIYDENNKITEIQVTPIDPWNGVFSNNPDPALISRTSSTYSPSGLSPATDKLVVTDFLTNVFKTTLAATSSDLNNYENQYKYIGKLQLATTLGYVDKNNNVDMLSFEAAYPNTTAAAVQAINDVISVYGNSPLLSTLYTAEYLDMYGQIFDSTSGFVDSIMLLVLIILFTISIIAVIFLSVEFILSAISVISILKALGFYDRTNAFSFLVMFFPAIILATLISIPLALLTMTGIQSFIYGFASIFLPLTFQWWHFFVGASILFAILAVTIGITIWLLKKQDITRVIARY